MGQRFPFSLFGGGGASSVSRDSTAKVHTGTGLVSGSVFIVFGNGTELGRANADGAGKAVVTLATAPAAGVVVSYTQTIRGGTIPAPPPTPPPSGGGGPAANALLARDGSSLLARDATELLQRAA